MLFQSRLLSPTEPSSAEASISHTDVEVARLLAARLDELRDVIRDRGADGMLISNPSNISYFSGLIRLSPTEREGTLFVPKEGPALLFLTAMYKEKAAIAEGTVSSLVEPVPVLDRNRILNGLKEHLKSGKVLIESDSLLVSELEDLKADCEIEFEPTKGLATAQRLTKDALELSYMRRAIQITDDIFNAVVHDLRGEDFTRLSEKDVLRKIQEYGEAFGAQGFGFETQVAFGPSSSQPHYKTLQNSNRLERSGPLLIDMGAIYEGYRADLTRTIHLGEPDPEFVRAYNLVLACNEACITACKPGASSGDLNKMSRQIFTDAGIDVDEHYTHSLGHGVGLDIHEAPAFRLASQHNLAPGMVVAIEPGLYFAGRFGIRIEDCVLITEDGHEVLSTKSPKELIVI
jgi:Xaa-Pro aminopeptidase